MTEGRVTVEGIQWRIKPEQGFVIFPYQFQYYSELSEPNIVWLILKFELQNTVVMDSFRNRIIDLDTSTIEQLNDILEHYQGIKPFFDWKTLKKALAVKRGPWNFVF